METPTTKTMKQKYLILIMARKGSNDVVSRQNLRLVDNKPLLYYIVKTALNFKQADVMVSTDSEEICELSLLYGSQYIKRPKNLTKNSTSVKEICYDALQKLQNENIHYEKCLVLHPKIPLIKINTIHKFFKNLEKNKPTIFGISDIINSKLGYKIENSKNLLKLEPSKNPLAILNRIVAFDVKKFLKNNGNFISPYYGLKLSNDETHSLISYHDFGVFEQIINRKKILVRIDSNVKIGMGHVFNMLTILNHFRNDEILIVMHRNRNLGYKQFKENLYNVTFFKNNYELRNIITSFKPDIIFNDILNTTISYMKKLQDFTTMTVNFEDRGEGRKLANLVFNPIFEKQKSLSNEFYGAKFACVRDEFRIWKNEVLSKNVKKVLISFGGTDPNNITEKTISIIQKNNMKDIEFTILLGFGYLHKKMIQDKIKKLQKDNFQIILIDSSDFIAKYARDVDFAIVSNGRTVFELAAMTIPILGVSVNNREQNHNFIKEQNVGIKIDYKKSSYEKSLMNSLEKMQIFNNRNKYKKNLKKIDLLDGINLVIQKINHEYGMLTQFTNQKSI